MSGNSLEQKKKKFQTGVLALANEWFVAGAHLRPSQQGLAKIKEESSRNEISETILPRISIMPLALRRRRRLTKSIAQLHMCFDSQPYMPRGPLQLASINFGKRQ